MGTMIRWMLLLAIGWSSFIFGQERPVTDGGASPLLVIIGASYAADWGTPQIPGYTVRNAGIGGEETKDMLERFDRDVVAARADAVLIWGHINSIHRAPRGDFAGAAERVQDDYEAMMAKAGQAGITVILATEISLTEAMGWTDRAYGLVAGLLGKRSYSSRINEHVRAVNEWLRALANEKGVRLLDFEEALDDGNGFRRREFTREDGSHVTEAAYGVLTDYTVRALGGP
jgi:lysophospholipase L1-like esterase